MSERNLEGRVAIVTGSGHGLGRAMAIELVARGARVVLNGRDAARVEQTRAELAGAAGEVAVCMGDVRDSATADRLVATAVERFGRLDVLVNNAGTNVIKPSVDLTDDEWQAIVETDLSAPFYCSRAAGRVMVEKRSGCIVNVSSIVGLTAFPMRAGYAAAKHGLIGLTKVLAVEWGPFGVRVNAICPGMFPMDKDISSMRVSPETLIGRTPLGRFGEASEVAKLVCYLASDDGAFISGAAIAIDGAWTAFGGWGEPGDMASPPREREG